MPQKSADSSHEIRLQHLESGLSELKVQHAEVSVNLRHLGDKVDASAARISDKIDGVFAPLAQQFQDHVKEDTVSRDKISAIDATVAHLAEKEQTTTQRWDMVKKALYAILTGAGAIGLKEMIVYLAHH